MQRYRVYQRHVRTQSLACPEGPDVRTLDPQSDTAAAKIRRYNGTLLQASFRVLTRRVGHLRFVHGTFPAAVPVPLPHLQAKPKAMHNSRPHARDVQRRARGGHPPQGRQTGPAVKLRPKAKQTSTASLRFWQTIRSCNARTPLPCPIKPGWMPENRSEHHN